MEKTKLLIVDDCDTIIKGLKYDLEDEFKDVFTIYSALQATEAFRIIRTEKINIGIIDISLKYDQDTNGIKLCKQLKQRLPNIKLISFSTFVKYAHIKLLLDVPVAGIVSKGDGNQGIIEALAPEYTDKSPYKSNGILRLTENRQMENIERFFTKKQKDVLRKLLEGHKSEEIANELITSVRNVEGHLQNIKDKLNSEFGLSIRRRPQLILAIQKLIDQNKLLL